MPPACMHADSLQQSLRELDLGEAPEGEDTEQQAQQGHRDPPPLLTFTPSVELNELVRPLDRCVWTADGSGQGCWRSML